MVESEDHESEKDQRTRDMYYTVFKRFSHKLVKVLVVFLFFCENIKLVLMLNNLGQLS